MMPNLHQLLRDHVSLSISCVDRLYLNGYVPSLQTSGQLAYFMRDHLGKPIPSPIVLKKITEAFRDEVKSFASQQHIPIVQFQRGQRKDDVAAKYRSRFEEDEGVVFIGVAQEKAYSFKASKRQGPEGLVSFDFSRQTVAVNHYYFYLLDQQWGPAFIKVCSYAPFPLKVCLNGHEWAKHQLEHNNIGFKSLDNGFLSIDDPERAQQLCDQLAPEDIISFYYRWSRQLPWPLTREDWNAGYDHRLTIWQIETSLTQVFERPVQGRQFFEQVIRENIDLGRPDRVSILFPTRHNRRTPAPPYGYRTRIFTYGVQPNLHVEYKKSHVKQYFKEQRALRTETTINDTKDVRLNKGIENLPELRNIGDEVNRKLLETERVGEHCVLSTEEMEQIHQPTIQQGHRAPALRFGDRRVMALFFALCLFFHLPFGFRNRDLRWRVAELLGLDPNEFSTGRMTYDLRRLRLKGIIERIPGTHRYMVTHLGLRVAYLHSKIYLRVFKPAWAASARKPDGIPRKLRTALNKVDQEIMRLCEEARLS